MIIDVHAHLSPPELAARFPMPPSLTDVDAMIAARDDAGIDLTIIGSPVGAGAMMRVPGVDNYRQPRDQLRAFHDWMAGVVARFPDRLRGYVYANPLGNDDHLDGVRESLDNPAFVGLIINSSIRGRYLDDRAADSFFALAAESDRPVLVHAPAEPAGTEQVGDMRFVEQINRFCDVTAGLAMIAFSGWLDRYPSLQIIGATGGGAITALPERLDAAASRPGTESGDYYPSPDPGSALRRIFVDTAIRSRSHLAMNVDVLGPGQVMFGTDSPPLLVPLPAAVAAVRALPISTADKEAVLGGTAARTFGLVTTQQGLPA